MIKITHIVLMATLVLTNNTAHAQTTAQNRKDTIVLSVYNTNQRFMLYPAPFGAAIGKTKLLTDLVAAYDTVHIKKQVAKKDTASKKGGMIQTFEISTVRGCDKIEGDLKGKVAIIALNTACDVSKQMFLAQKAGAKAVIIIHSTNSKDSVWLDHKKEYAFAKQITIPCYTVRAEMGVKICQMLPSLVGIARKDTSTVPIQSLKEQVDSLQRAIYDKTASINFDSTHWAVAPNPADDEVTIYFNFSEKQNCSLSITNAAGDLLQTQKREMIQSGTFAVDVTQYPAGFYNFNLQHGRYTQTKRVLVTR